MSVSIFVGRTTDLHRLDQFLGMAVSGQVQVVFIAGEAGAGKSALVSEFVRRAEDASANVISVVGECNAQTGAGDPYLPFRQMLTELTTGSDEATLEDKAVEKKNAHRLKEFVRVSGETLLDIGPDLINIFVPGASLVAKVAMRAAKLGKLSERIGMAGAPTDSPPNAKLNQEKIFEQYTEVIRALARERTLILVLDDLQWADSGSLNLLFHLARELKDSPVMLVGTYRPDDVAIGRPAAGPSTREASGQSSGQVERHPLEPILNELRRYNGDIVIDLAQSSAGEGRAFVDALVDAEPNRLDAAFRQKLFARTDGHPLFTVELLHHLQECGDLVKDADGKWTQGEALNWEALPARVEGVIEERIARLAADLRETLTVGSVMGNDFIAQIVARVQKVRERDLIRSLSRELDKRYRLVSERGEVKVGKVFLSLYQFSHIVFQQFLYNELGMAERRLMHADVAEALEALYEGHTDDIAVQLAHHYLEVGDDEKASGYLIRAGDAAAKAYAPVEARLHYARSLDTLARLPDSADNRRRRVDTLIKQAHVSIRATGPQITLANMRQAEAMLENLNDGAADRLRRARVDYWIAHAYLHGNQMREAVTYMQRVLPVAQELNDADLLAIPASVLGRVLVFQGRFDKAASLLGQAIPLLEKVENWHEWALATNCYAFALVAQGRVAEGIGAAQAGLVRMSAVNTATGIALSRGGVSQSYFMAGDWTRALEHAQLALDVATNAGDRVIMYSLFGTSAMARVQLGDLQAADRDVAQWQAIVKQVGGHVVFDEFFAVGPAESALRQNHVAEALTLAEQAAALSQAVGDIFAEGWARRVQAQAEARLEPPLCERAEAHLAESLRLFEEGGARLDVARTHVAWGKLLAQRGNLQTAREHLELAAVQYEASGLDEALTETRNLMSGL